MRVIHLEPGMQFMQPPMREDTGEVLWTFVAQTPHPLYPGLQMVIWKDVRGNWSHDALSPGQDVGEPLPHDMISRRNALTLAFKTTAKKGRKW